MSGLRARLQAFFGGLQRWYAGHPPRDQRIILGVLVFAAVCVLYLWAWVPLREYRQSVADEIVDGQEQLARAVRILDSAESVRAERDGLEQKLKQSRERLLPGRGATLGAAALQERTNSLAAEKGITVQSTQVMKEEAVDPYRKVSVRLTLSGELKPFAEFVSALEYDQQLAVPIVEINRRGAVPGAKGPRTLSATIEVTGFVLSEEAKADEGAPAEGGEAVEAGVAEGGDAAKIPAAPPGSAPTGPAPAVPAPTGAPTGPAVAVPGPTGGPTGPPRPASGPTGAPTGSSGPAAASGSIPASPSATKTSTAPTVAPRAAAPTSTTLRAKTTTTTRPVPTPPRPISPPARPPVPQEGAN